MLRRLLSNKYVRWGAVIVMLVGVGVYARRETAIHCLAIRIDGTPLWRVPTASGLERAAERYARQALADHDSGRASVCQRVQGWGRARAAQRWLREFFFLQYDDKYIVATRVARDAWDGNYKYPDPALEPRKGFFGRMKDRFTNRIPRSSEEVPPKKKWQFWRKD